MKRKNILASLLAVCMLLACLASCTSPSVSPSVSPSASDEGSSEDLPSPTPSAEPSPSDDDDPQLSDDGLFPLADFQGVSLTFNNTQELDHTVLEFYYNAFVSDFISSYYSMLEMLSLTLDAPFSEQAYPFAEETTWHDYFYENSVYRLHTEYAINEELKLDGVTLSAEDEADIEAILQSYRDAYPGGNDVLLENLRERFGQALTLESFTDQLRISLLTSNWQSELSKSVSFTDDELRASMEASGQLEELNYPTVNVRHILVSEEDLANQILTDWQENPTEDNFAAMVPTYTEDTASSVTGGLYEGIKKGDMIEAFEDWCFDETRQPGDTGIVQTDYGYHVMYFSAVGELAWKSTALSTLTSNYVSDEMAALREKYPLTIDR